MDSRTGTIYKFTFCFTERTCRTLAMFGGYITKGKKACEMNPIPQKILEGKVIDTVLDFYKRYLNKSGRKKLAPLSGWPNAAKTTARIIRTATVEIRYLFIIPTSKKS